MGRGYVIEHCMSALREQADERLYRTYITDALKLIAENSQKAAVPGVGVIDVGSVLTKRWAELIDAQKEEKKKPEDNRPAAEIAHDIWKRIRGE